jgi:hypothetical protein
LVADMGALLMQVRLYRGRPHHATPWLHIDIGA